MINEFCLKKISIECLLHWSSKGGLRTVLSIRGYIAEFWGCPGYFGSCRQDKENIC